VGAVNYSGNGFDPDAAGFDTEEMLKKIYPDEK
jgi:hypothetical protein